MEYVDGDTISDNIVANEYSINDKKKITDDKLIFLKAISNVIKTGMNIVDVSVPEKM